MYKFKHQYVTADSYFSQASEFDVPISEIKKVELFDCDVSYIPSGIEVVIATCCIFDPDINYPLTVNEVHLKNLIPFLFDISKYVLPRSFEKLYLTGLNTYNLENVTDLKTLSIANSYETDFYCPTSVDTLILENLSNLNTLDFIPNTVKHLYIRGETSLNSFESIKDGDYNFETLYFPAHMTKNNKYMPPTKLYTLL